MKNEELTSRRYKEIEAYRASGQKAEEWCKEKAISLSTLRYWITKENQRNRHEQPEFIAFTPARPESSPLTVKLGSYEIQVKPGFDPETLREAIRILKNL